MPETQKALPLAGVPVLVTGATGKLGRRLVTALAEKEARVTILTRSPERARLLWPGAPIRCHAADLTDAATLVRGLRGSKVIFHLASHSPAPDEPNIYEASAHWSVTAEGTRNLVEAAVAAGVERLVYLSSVKAMGDAAGAAGRPADESTPARPDTLYGRAKLEAERLILQAGANHPVHTGILRLPMVYGTGGTGNIARMIDAVARRRFPPWPRIQNRRSAIHLEDAVQAALLAACHPRAAGGLFLVTDGEAYSTRWLYERICLALGRSIPGWVLPLGVLSALAAVGSQVEHWTGRAMPLTRTSLSKLTGNAWYSSEKLRRELGFEPRRRLAEEIPRMVRDYLAQDLAKTPEPPGPSPVG